VDIGIWGYGFLILVFGLMIFGGSLFVEWLAIKHVMDNPASGLLASIFGAFLVLLIGYVVTGNMDSTGLIALIGGLLFALAISFPNYLKRKKNFAQTQMDDLPS
jgi:lipid-A-disaccharide synthase-like uncharacterized protein